MYKKILCALMILSTTQPLLGFTQFYSTIKNLFNTTSTDDSFLARHEFDPTITFSNVIGLYKTQERLSWILNYVENPEYFARAGIIFDRVILLEGPARSGKTFVSMALAGEIRNLLVKQKRNPREFNCYQIHAHEIIQEISAPRLVAALKKNSPCIVLIDEIDLLFRHSMGGNCEEFSLFLGSLFSDNVQEHIFIIGMTNHYDYIPKLGIFGPEVIHFEYPDFADRKEFITNKLQTLFLQDPAINSGIYDMDKLALISEGASYDHLNHLIRTAFQKSKIYKRAFSQELLEEVFIEECKRFIPKSTQE